MWHSSAVSLPPASNLTHAPLFLGLLFYLCSSPNSLLSLSSLQFHSSSTSYYSPSPLRILPPSAPTPLCKPQIFPLPAPSPRSPHLLADGCRSGYLGLWCVISGGQVQSAGNMG